jgi:hypothetical protein
MAIGQDLKTQEMGTLGLSDVKTTTMLDNKIIVPPLGEDEGILRIELGSKLQAFLMSLSSNEKKTITIQLGRDVVLLTEVKSLVFPNENYYQVRFRGQYVGKQQSSRPTIQIKGLPYFSVYKDVVRLYKNKVNTVVLEIDKAPLFTESANYSAINSNQTANQKIKARRKKLLWFFILTSVAGTAFILTSNNGSDSGSDFPTPPNRPNN